MVFSKKDVGGLTHCTIFAYSNSYVPKISYTPMLDLTI